MRLIFGIVVVLVFVGERQTAFLRRDLLVAIGESELPARADEVRLTGGRRSRFLGGFFVVREVEPFVVETVDEGVDIVQRVVWIVDGRAGR